MRHFLTLKDLTREEIKEIIDKSIELKNNPEMYSDAMKQKTLLMLFQKSSLRTRISFEVVLFVMKSVIVQGSLANFLMVIVFPLFEIG